jgi:hypothetical protein
VASTLFWLQDPRERIRLFIALACAGIGIGTWLGALAGVVATWGRRESETVLRDALRVAGLIAVPMAFVAYWLFTGGKARRLPALVVIRPVAWMALVAASAAAIAIGARGVLVVRKRERIVRASVTVAFVAAAQILHSLDHRVLPRLYEYLHGGLGVATALAWAGAIAVAVPAPREWRRVDSLVVAGLVAAPLAFLLLERWDNVRAEVFGVHAPFVRHAMIAVETLRPVRTQGRQRATRTARVDAHGLAARPGTSLLLVTIDALRDDRIGRTVGGHSLTPHLDALASLGVRFARTYSQAPHSSYSLTTLHTSEYLHETVPLGQPQPLATIADQLARAGYYTAAFYTQGIFFTEGERLTVYRDRAFGFRRADHVDRRAPAQAEAAMREIDDIARRGAAPAFVWVHFFDAHEPYGGTGATPEAQYDDAVRQVDRAVGTLVEHARSRLGADLLVAVTADHGEEFGEHGGVYHGSALYEEQVRVPWILAGAGLPHARVDSVAQLVDLAPTVLGVLGVEPAASMHGDDLRPWIYRRTNAPRMAFAGVNTRTMSTDGTHKLIVDRRYGVRELYDLVTDARETHNIATDRADAVRSLDAALDGWSDALGARATGRAVLARARMGDHTVLADVMLLALDRRASSLQRIEAMNVLAGYDDAIVTAPLVPLLRDASREVGDAAAMALGRTGHDEARERLHDAVARDEPETRAQAAIALAHLRDTTAIEPLVELLATGDEPERIEAVDALGALRSAEAIAPLEDALADDHLRYRTVLALGRIGGPRVRERLARIAREDRADDVRANAGAALAVAGDRSATPLLRDLLRDDRAQRYAASAIGRLGGAVYDARTDASHICRAIDDGPVWRLLDARMCQIDAPLTVVTGSSRGRVLTIRARGRGTLRVFADTQEIAHVDLEPVAREWRMRLDARPALLRLEGSDRFDLGHVVLSD